MMEHTPEFSHTTKEEKLKQLVDELALEVDHWKRRARDAEAAKEEFRKLAITDALTRLRNRHALPEAVEHRKASEKPWSLLFLDVDSFKGINDKYGHDAGDAVLRSIAERLASIFRSEDEVVRYGGEEFAVVLKDAVPQDIIDKLTGRANAEDKSRGQEPENRAKIGLTVNIAGQELPVTLSGGITAFERDEDIESAITRADEALLYSKQTGKNKISVYERLPEKE